MVEAVAAEVAAASTATPTASSPPCARTSPAYLGPRPVSPSRPSRCGPATAPTRCCSTCCRPSAARAARRWGSPRRTRCTRSSPRTHGTAWVDGLRGVPGGGAFDLDADGVAAQVASTDPHVVFLCSPNNPTGTALGARRRAGRRTTPRPSAIVVVDEAYAEFARPGTPSALTLLPRRPRLVVTRTMSKAFAFAGGGWATSPPTPAADRRPAPGAAALPPVLAHPGGRARRARARAERCWRPSRRSRASGTAIVGELAALGLDPVPSDANFVLFGGLADERATWRGLLDAGRPRPRRRHRPPPACHGGHPARDRRVPRGHGAVSQPPRRQEQSA